jgi:hypothetical protein
MAAHAHQNQTGPVQRGVFFRNNVLCQTLPPPPDNVDTTPPDPSPDLSTRERFKEHSENAACASCHALIDPVGFIFESYDGIGKFRTEENDLPLDSSGEILSGDDLEGTYADTQALTSKMQTSPVVRNCMASLWMEYSYQRLSQAGDSCSVNQVRGDFATSGYDLRALIRAVLSSDGFRYVKLDI